MNRIGDRVISLGRRGALGCVIACCAILGLAAALSADQVDLQNGDHYVGRVLSLDSVTLVLHSDVLGNLRLPRAQVAAITLGDGATNSATRVAAAPTGQSNTPPAATSEPASGLAASLSQFGGGSNLLQQIQSQMVGSEGAEAKQKFNSMVSGLMSGQLSVGDIRAQAQSAAAQLKQLKAEMGGEASGALDGYLAILESFLGQSAPAGRGAVATKPPAARPAPEPTHAAE